MNKKIEILLVGSIVGAVAVMGIASAVGLVMTLGSPGAIAVAASAVYGLGVAYMVQRA